MKYFRTEQPVNYFLNVTCDSMNWQQPLADPKMATSLYCSCNFSPDFCGADETHFYCPQCTLTPVICNMRQVPNQQQMNLGQSQGQHNYLPDQQANNIHFLTPADPDKLRNDFNIPTEAILNVYQVGTTVKINKSEDDIVIISPSDLPLPGTPGLIWKTPGSPPPAHQPPPMQKRESYPTRWI